jgi:hypothetical protein
LSGDNGEILTSESAAAAARLATEGVESREIELKGIIQPVAVRVLRLALNQAGAA